MTATTQTEVLHGMDAADMAKTLFNETWSLIDKKNRTKEEDAEMLHKAHTSCYLWGIVGTPLHKARGEWQVSRAYSTLSMGHPALLHGVRSLSLCEHNGIGGFDLAFGYEAVARALALLGEKLQAEETIAMARSVCSAIPSADDRDYLLRELNSIG